jgi:type IV pilus assembly protein PilX
MKTCSLYRSASRRNSITLVSPGQCGATLVVTLIILIAVSLMGVSTAHIALLGEKFSRNDRDRQIAFQAAEAALLDAELDISGTPDEGRSRSALFASHKTDGFVDNCGAGAKNVYLGLCRHTGDQSQTAWLTVNFLDESAGTMRTVPYGTFTGQYFQTGSGMLPAKPPRYIIELISNSRAGENAAIEERSYLYRITAVGFGAREGTRVMLQTVYSKAQATG